ncbi:unnamed protein product, partial [Brenthis ino]
MNSLVSLLSAAALLSLQCVVYAQINGKVEMNNNLEPNVLPTTRHSTIRNYIRIMSPPPETVRHLPGTTLVLTCQMRGNPSPVVNWMKNGVPITDFEEDVNEILSIPSFSPTEMTSKLVLRSASNGDIFSCVGTSGLLEISASTAVIVVGENQPQRLTSIIQSKPVITTFYNNIFQYSGSSATLPCRVDSPTKSQIIWLDNNGDIVYGNNRLRVLPSGDLHIADLSWDDMGGYTCTAKNAFGKDVIETFLYPLKV